MKSIILTTSLFLLTMTTATKTNFAEVTTQEFDIVKETTLETNISDEYAPDGTIESNTTPQMETKMATTTLVSTPTPLPPPKLGKLTSLERYKIMSHLVEHLVTRDLILSYLNVSHEVLYNHVFRAFSVADLHRSSIMYRGENVTAVNLVYKHEDIPNMYAEQPMDKFFDFVISCYDSQQPTLTNTKTWVSLFRSYDSDDMKEPMIAEMMRHFKGEEEQEKYIFMYEPRSMSQVMHRNHFIQIACGLSCNWLKLGIPESQAVDICLYGDYIPGMYTGLYNPLAFGRRGPFG